MMMTPAEIERALAIRRHVRLASGRPDGRCGQVSEAIAAELSWAYRWGHLRLLDGGICWIHCWNQLPDGTIVDATADQFEERWLGPVAVLPGREARHANYRPAPPAHLFRVVRGDQEIRLLVRCDRNQGGGDADEQELVTAPATLAGWAAVGAHAVQVHSGWQLPAWINEEAGEHLRAAEATGQALPSRALEFALDATDRQRRNASHGEWTSPEWRETLEQARR
jgi:hypothetical protein